MKSTLFFFLSWLSCSPKLAKQVHGALPADTQQVKLQEGSNGDGGAWKSGDWQRGRLQGCSAAVASTQKQCWLVGGDGEVPRSREVRGGVNHAGRPQGTGVKWELKKTKSEPAPTIPAQTSGEILGRRDSGMHCAEAGIGDGGVFAPLCSRESTHTQKTTGINPGLGRQHTTAS